MQVERAEPASRAGSPEPRMSSGDERIQRANVPSIAPPGAAGASVSAPRNVGRATSPDAIASRGCPPPVDLPAARMKESAGPSIRPGVSDPLASIGKKGRPDAAASERLKWLAGERGRLRAELDNGWRGDLSKAFIEVEKSLRPEPGKPPVIVTRRIQRAASPRRDVVVAEHTKPISEADELDRVMLTYPIELPQMELDREDVAAFSMESLRDRHMQISWVTPGVRLVMNNGYGRQQDLFSLGSLRTPRRDVNVYTVDPNNKEHFIQLKIEELDLGRGPENPRIRQHPTVIRRERLPREFLDFFYGRANPDDWNKEIREAVNAACGGPHSRAAAVFKDDTEPESDSESDTSSEAPSSGRQSPAPAASESAGAAVDAPAADDRLVVYGRSGISLAALADLMKPLDERKMRVYKAGLGEAVAVAGMFGPQPILHMLRLDQDDPAQVRVRTVRVLGYRDFQKMDSEGTEDPKIPLHMLNAEIQTCLRARTVQPGEKFDSECLFGPDPNSLKSQFFKVNRAHMSHRPGRCVVLDNEQSFMVDSQGREQQKFTLLLNDTHIEVKIRNQKRADIKDLQRGSSVAETYVLHTKFFHPDMVALIRGEDSVADQWNAEVAKRMKEFENQLDPDRHDDDSSTTTTEDSSTATTEQPS